MLTVLVLSVLDGKYREPLLPREIPLSPQIESNEFSLDFFLCSSYIVTLLYLTC